MAASLSPCQLIAEHIGALYQCSPSGKYVRIHTPFLYPDGDALELYWHEDYKMISDVGETLRWLDGQTLTQRRSKRHLQLIDDVCATNGVQFSEGNLSIHIRAPADMAAAVVRLTQACVQVADLWFTFRTRMFESFPDEVEELLVSRSLPYSRGETVIGGSGKSWRVDFHTLSPQTESLVFALSTGTRGATRRIAEHVVAACVDLKASTKKISLFDDTVDVWATDDFKLVEAVSDVQRWSRPDEFLEALAA